MIFFGNFYSERVKKPARRGCGAEIVDEATKPDFPDVCLLIQSKLVLHTKENNILNEFGKCFSV